METTTYERQLIELRNKLDLLEDEEIVPVDRLRHTLPLISGIVDDLKEKVIAEGFATPDEEIRFFKEIKPQFYALQLYEVLYYNLCSQIPAGTKEMTKAFYEEELLQVLRVFRVNAFHYQYYKTKATVLDHLYFIRDARPTDIPIIDVIDAFPRFSTAMDYSFAKFIAYERLQEHLLDLLNNTQREYRTKKTADENKNKFIWTGETINLVELAYGIWLTGQVNNGNASITEIIHWLEIHFHVTIGRAYRRWTSLSNRKRISRIKFLDQMRDQVLKRMDDELK